MTRWKLGLLVVVSLVSLVSLLILVVILKSIPKAIEEKIVAEVNGEPITMEEFMGVAMDQRAASFGSENPSENIKEKALNKLSEIKVQQLLAKEAGLVEDVSYSYFKRQLELENQTRKERLAKREVIFGPQQYSEKTYFNYVFNKMVIDLKRTLGNSRFTPSDQDLMNHYDKGKNERFKIPDTIKIKKIYINNSEPQALEEITRIREKLDSSHNLNSFEGVAKEFEAGYKEYTFSSSTNKEDLAMNESLLKAVNKLNPGQVVGPFKEDDLRVISIAMVTERIEQGYQKFEDVKEQLKGLYIDAQYEDFIKVQVENANLVIHHNVYNQIHIE